MISESMSEHEDEGAKFWASVPPEKHAEMRALIEAAKKELDDKIRESKFNLKDEIEKAKRDYENR